MRLRRIARKVALGLALGALAPQALPPIARAAGAAHPQAIAGWQRMPAKESDEGIIFRCEADTCGGATAYVAIVRRQEVWPHVTSEMFMYTTGLVNADDLATVSSTRVAPSLRALATREGLNVFTSWQEKIQPDGTRGVMLNGLVPGPTACVTVVVVAATRAQATANFEAFLPEILPLAR